MVISIKILFSSSDRTLLCTNSYSSNWNFLNILSDSGSWISPLSGLFLYTVPCGYASLTQNGTSDNYTDLVRHYTHNAQH